MSPGPEPTASSAHNPHSPHSWPSVLAGLVQHRDLEAAETGWVMREILSGEATPAQIAGFAVAMRSKGETVGEVEGLVATMYEFAPALAFDGPTVDVVGTGGDRSHTVNISTMAAIVAAGAGVTVAKHGNRAASSKAGAADVLEQLGIRLDLTPDQVLAILHEVGITFCFAPVFHAGLRHSAVPRRELGVPTTFNFLGPLANPAKPIAQAVGVSDSRMAGIIAGVLGRRGVSGYVFRGDDGLDELTTTTTSHVWAIESGNVVEATFDAADLGLARSSAGDLTGGEAAFNADVVRRVVAGERGAIRDAVLLNAAATISAFEVGTGAAAGGTTLERMASALVRATAAIDDGSAERKLDAWLAAVAVVTAS